MSSPDNRRLWECRDCPIWPPNTQSGHPYPEKILACIRHVLGDKRHWLTAEEFLAQVEVHRAAKLREKRNPPKLFVPGPFVRTYVLDPNHKFRPKPKVPTKPEVAP